MSARPPELPLEAAFTAEELRLDRFNEECGVFGILGDPEAAHLTYLGLHALQHRGQEGAGIATSDGSLIRCVRGRGLVHDIFGGAQLATLTGSLSIGHNRYSTAGDDSLRNIQPFVVRYQDGQIAIAHNGNLVNAPQLREELEARGSIFTATSDTEVILHLIATSQQSTLINRLVDALSRVQGAWSLLLATETTLVAVRDPYGFRPLVLGRRGSAWVACSETCALDLIGATLVREVQPGEMVIIDPREGVTSLRPFPRRPRRACVFEHIYFARPDSQIFGRSVYETRVQLGRLLARSHPVPADVVVPVPDSGVPGALGYSQESGTPYQLGLLRSHYVGRTFIEPSQQIRDFGVKLKLSPVRSVLEGRRVVVVDDSIVRGTTSRKIVRLLRAAGAKEVHVRVTAPPTTGSCFYGIDTPTREELIASRLDLEGIRAWLEADSVGYLPLETLREAEGEDRGRYCEACFSGEYPIEVRPEAQQVQMPLFVKG